MDTNKIKIKPLALSLAAILVTEYGVRAILLRYHLNALGTIGIIRLIEIALMCITVWYCGNGFGSIGLSVSGTIKGLEKGMIWSAGFGLMAFAVLMVLYLMDVQLFSIIRISMPSAFHSIILLFLVAGFISPIAEEIFFRGLLYGYFRRWGILIAVILSTAVFVLLHSFTTQIPISQMIGGVVFAVSYEVEKNLIVPIIIHMLGNMALFSLSLML